MDAICPTFAAGTISIISNNSVVASHSDSALAGGANGVTGQFPSSTAGSFNNEWANGVLTQSVAPTFSSGGLNTFGRTGLQS